MHIEPYLFFEGRTEEALQFYQKALGAKVELMMRNKESPEPPPPGMNAPADKIMHASFTVDGARVMASLRNLAISLCRLAGAANIAAALRACAYASARPLRLIGLALA